MSEKGEIYIVRIDDGGAPLRDVFKPDYAKARELETGKIRLTEYHWFAIEKLAWIIKDSTIQQKGINFVRRRMVIFGMGKLEEEHNEKLKKLTGEYEKKFLEYDRRRTQKYHGANIIGDNNGTRYMIYLDETDFGRLKEIAKIISITQDSVMRLSINYSILHLENYFDQNLLEEVKRDIEELNEYIEKM